MSFKVGGVVEAVLKVYDPETQVYELNLKVPPTERLTSHFAEFPSHSGYDINHRFTTGLLSDFQFQHGLRFVISREQMITIQFVLSNIYVYKHSFSVGPLEVHTIINRRLSNKTDLTWIKTSTDVMANNGYRTGKYNIRWEASFIATDIQWNESVDTLKLIFTIQLENFGTLSVVQDHESLEELDKTEIPKEIFTKQYFLSKSMSDITIVDKIGNELPAHRLILSGHSSVFQLMFQQEMKEAIEGCVVIDDIDADVLKEMLHFIYAGHLSENSIIKTKAIDLYKSAHKYDIEALKKATVKQIGTTISLDNGLEVYTFGDLYREQGLMDKSLGIMKKDKLLLIQDNSDLLREILTKFPKLGMELFKA